MRRHSSFGILVFICIGVLIPLVGCGSSDSLSSIQVSPATQSVAVAGVTQFSAMGTYTRSGHQTITKDITSQVTWSSSDIGVATINSSGAATGVSAGSTSISASMNGSAGMVTNTAALTVTGGTGGGGKSPGIVDVTALSVIPSSQTVSSINETSQFIAIGTTSQGPSVDLTTQVTWGSSDQSVATISASGLATALKSGTTTMTAIYTNPDDTVVTASATFTVTVSSTSEPLVSLAIVPGAQTVTAINQPAQFIAIATTATGTTVNLTNQSAIINGATISAATWSSSNPALATINAATGIATALSAGTTAITAIAKNPDGTVVTASASFTVNTASAAEPLVSLAIVPGSQSVAATGQTSQFVAIGTFSPTSSTPGSQNMANVTGYTVTWSSSNPQVATIDATGKVTAVGQGTTAITAIATNNTDKSGSLATATFTVLGPSTQQLTSLSVLPSSQAVTLPLATSTTLQIAQFIAIGTNGSTGLQQNVTNQVVWTSSNPVVASINSSGLATALSQGSTTITAVATNKDSSVVTATSTLTVAGTTSEPLLSLAILPNSQSVASPGLTSQLVAIGTFSAAPNTQDLTSNSTTYPIKWSSSDTAVATVGSPEKAGTIPGLVTAVGQGTTAIIAVASNPDGSLVTSTGAFTVIGGLSEPISALTIVPSSQSAYTLTQTGQFVAIGTNGSTGLQEDMTSRVTWSSSNVAVATISSSGLATPVSPGTTIITAQYTNPDNSLNIATANYVVTSAPEPLISISVLPASQSVFTEGETGQFIAVGTSSTGAFLDLTGSVTWSSSDTTVATINASGAATALNVGTTGIIAKATNPDGTVVTGVGTFEDLGSLSSIQGLGTLTVYMEGGNNTTWEVTAPSVDGTVPQVIHCGPGFGAASGGSVCVGTYSLGSNVVLTANPGSGSFLGWSSNCTVGPANVCTVQMNENEAVGVIFY